MGDERLEQLTCIPPFVSQFPDETWMHTNAQLSVLQINVGRLCNLACKHCHVEAGPTRTEIMGREVLETCLTLMDKYPFETVDITGGAPEMNPNFRWFLAQAAERCPHVIVRTNLVVLLEAGFEDLPEYYQAHRINVVCSLPHYTAKSTDRMRGDAVFERSIQALHQLNALGYGSDPALVLDLVHNPGGAFLPPKQGALEVEFRDHLSRTYGVQFNHLFAITNNPIGRFGAFLERSGNLEGYLNKLHKAFNAGTLAEMMCRGQISVGWDGRLYDCDFNQAADLPIESGQTIFDWAAGEKLPARRIRFGNHCYACTAGQGSSCGGITS